VTHQHIPIAPAAPTPERRRRQPRGRAVDPAAHADISAWLGETPWPRDRLIEALHVVNDRCGQLPAPHLVALAAWMKLSMAEVFEVASFYHHFEVVHEDAQGRVPPAAALTVRVCDGIACEMAGARDLLARLPAVLGPAVRVLAAPCLGRCDTAPAAVVHRHPVPQADVDAVLDAVQSGRREEPVTPTVDFDAYRAAGGYTLWSDLVDGRRSAEAVLGVLDAAGLRGLGGAGFPSGRKWRIVRDMPAPRHLAVNLDEGEPGTFKDRWCLEQDPHRLLEGLLVAAHVVGIDAAWIYLRDEYPGLRRMLAAELDKLRAWAPHPLPRLDLRRGAGAYVCGEESAMIESIEGRRGLPRLRPPFVAEVGLFGRPTLAHNGETLYWVRELVEQGPEAFAAQGRQGRRGLRRFSVSGRVARPGVHLAPAGITLRELVDEFAGGMQAGHTLYGYLPGGASGGILPASLADLPLDFDTLQPHGAFIGSAAVIVLSQHDRVVDIARNAMRFFRDESCGQCTPCRAGTAKALALMQAPRWDRTLLAELSQVMRDASICGLGQAAPNTFDSVLRHFPDAWS
jgi:formate dehydrogenase